MPRGISWSFNETEALIRLWADSSTQTALRLNSRNRCIYEDIANNLQALGVTRTADQCQMRIKLLKKMYRQTKEAMKRGDVFQQRPCPFYNEMHRIFSGNEEDANGTSLVVQSQSFLNDDDDDDVDENEEEQEDNSIHQESKHIEPSTSDDRFSRAIDRMIEYQQQTETRWYKYLEQQANLELQRRQEDRAFQLQLIQILTNFISSQNSSPSAALFQQSWMNPSGDKLPLQQQENNIIRQEKRRSSNESVSEKKKSKSRQTLPSNFYSLLAQIHNIDSVNRSE